MLLLILGAVASEIFPRPVPLDTVIQESTLIVTARPAKDPVVVMPSAYPRTDRRFMVLEVLKGSLPENTSELLVVDGMYPVMALVQKAYEDGISESPYVRVFEGPELTAEAKRILFLKVYDDRWIETVDAAHMPFSSRKQVKRTIAAGPEPLRPDLVITPER